MAWVRRRYRGNKVWIETDAAGAYVTDERGLARLRYKPEDDRTYSVRPSEVRPVDADEAPEAPAPRPPRRASRPARRPEPEAPPPAEDAAPNAADAPPAPDAGDGFEPGDDVPALAGLAVHAYTDGASSGNPGPAGIGVVLLFREHRKEISRYLGRATNNVAELTAVLDALRAIRRRDLPVRVHVDSSYAIGVLDGSYRAKANPDLVAQIRREIEGFPDLRFVKVSGHAGVEWNERADALAREAIRKHRPRGA